MILKNRTYFSAIIIGTLMMGCTSPAGFKIQGSVDQPLDWKVFLLSEDKGGDTLAVGKMVNGKFELNGKVEKVALTSLVLEGLPSQLPIYLENSTYQITLDLQNFEKSKIAGGGVSQQIASAFLEIEQDVANAIDGIREEYIEAVQEPEGERFAQLNHFLDSIHQHAESLKSDLLKKNPNTFFALNQLAMISSRLSLEELKAEFDKFDSSLQNSSLGSLVKKQIERMEAVSVGKVMPDFTLQTPNGEFFTLHSVKGSVKLYDFWASWCSPCRRLVPVLKKLYAEYHSKGLEIVGISMDDNKTAWKKAIEEEQMQWVQGSDLKGFKADNELNKLYNINNGIPHFVLVDAQNRILAIGNDFRLIREKLIESMNN